MSPALLLGVGMLAGSIIVSAIISYRISDAPRSWRGFWHHVLPPDSFRHPSGRADIIFFISRALTNLVVVVPGAAFVFGVGAMVNRLLQHVMPLPPSTTAATTGLLILFSLTMMLIYDFSYFLFHFALHRVPLLWEIHKVHHSAEVMVGLTKYRVHPLETFIQHLWDAVFVGTVYGVWLFFAYDPVELAVFGIDIYRFRNILLLDVIRHTDYPIGFGPVVGKIFISPHYHQLHHSAAREHWDKNLGLGLAVWDWLFGTLMAPKPNEVFTYGLRLTDRESQDYHALWRLYTVAVIKMVRMANGRRRPPVPSMNTLPPGDTGTSY